MRSTSLRAGLVAVLAAVTTAAPAIAQQETLEPISTRTGVFTAEQASTGEELFMVVCGECHQPADFEEETFLAAWAGQTVEALFKEIRATMPEDSPGSLKSSEYAAILAYLFRLNGLPPGDSALPASTRRMQGIVIEPPAPKEEGGPR